MTDLRELKDGWGQPDPPSPDTRADARAALIREIAASHASEPVARWRGRRLGWLVGATVMAAAVAAVAVVSGPTDPTTPEQVAEPPAPSGQVSGEQILLRAAEVARSQPAGTGAYWHWEQELPAPDSPKPLQRLQEWTSRDGVHYTMPDGYPGVMRIVLSTGFPIGSSWLTLAELETLPTEPEALKAWLSDAVENPRPVDGGPIGMPPGEVPPEEVTNRVAGGLTRLLWEVPAPPAVRSAALRALATLPNVTNLGASDGGQVLRISYGAPPADKYPDGKVPPGAGELTLVIDPETATLISSSDHEGTTKILAAGWTDDLPKIIPAR